MAAWDAAREHGLGAITLRDVAERVGMRAPSLYWHFPSKMALYDAMFGQAWRSYLEVQTDLETRLPASPRRALRMDARAGMLDYISGRTELTLRLDREHGGVST